MRLRSASGGVMSIIGLAGIAAAVALAQAPASRQPTAPANLEQAQRAVARLQSGQRGRIERPSSYDALTPEQKAYVHGILDGPRSDIPPPLAVMLVSPGFGDPAQKAVAYARFAGTPGFSSIPPKLSELAILIAARRWRGEYVWHAHHTYAVKVGLSPEVVEAIRTGKRPPKMEKDVEAAYNVLDEMLTQAHVSDATFQVAKGALGGDRAVIDLIASFASYSISSMMVMVDQTPLPDGVKPYLQPLK
jgi:4-carboxymuconolactone decarboxylase